MVLYFSKFSVRYHYFSHCQDENVLNWWAFYFSFFTKSQWLSLCDREKQKWFFSLFQLRTPGVFCTVLCPLLVLKHFVTTFTLCDLSEQLALTDAHNGAIQQQKQNISRSKLPPPNLGYYILLLESVQVGAFPVASTKVYTCLLWRTHCNSNPVCEKCSFFLLIFSLKHLYPLFCWALWLRLLWTAFVPLLLVLVHFDSTVNPLIHSKKQLLRLKSQCTTTTRKHEAASAVCLPPASLVYSFSRSEHTGWNRNEVSADERVLPQPPPQPLISRSYSCAAVMRQIWRGLCAKLCLEDGWEEPSAKFKGPVLPPLLLPFTVFWQPPMAICCKSSGMKLQRRCRSVCLIVPLWRVLSKLPVSHQFYLPYPQQRWFFPRQWTLFFSGGNFAIPPIWFTTDVKKKKIHHF